MLVRKLAMVTMAAALAFTTAGCSALSPIATQNAYQPGDGVNADVNGVAVRNFVYLVGSTDQGALIGSLINQGTSTTQVTIVGTTTAQVSLGAGEKVDFGYNGSKAIDLGVTAKAGSDTSLTINVAGKSVTVNVPVLDGTFSEYAGLVSTATATPKG